MRESEVAEQRADLQKRGAECKDFMVESGTPEAEELRRRRLQERAEARERGETRHEDTKEAFKHLRSLWSALHLTHENPRRRVTPEDVVAQYRQRMDTDVTIGYGERRKEEWQRDVQRYARMSEWLEGFAEGLRSEVEARIRIEEKAASKRRSIDEVERLNQKWKDSGGYVEE